MTSGVQRTFLAIAVLLQLCSVFSEPHIEVFIVPHSHDDVGWIMPWERYYTTQVKNILDTVTEALHSNPERKYNQVEIQFMRYWWNHANETTREKMRKAASRGQLEFNIGGITMNDEACTVYNEEINQMTDGHRWIQDNFGVVPEVGWHVDPFGHSSATASLWSLMGFSAHSINRIPEDVKTVMQNEQGLEFVWRGSKSLGRHTEIWTHTLSPHYYPPAEMSFDDLNISRNMSTIAEQCVDVMRRQQKWYRHNLQLITWGGDFSHQDAITDFHNMDNLMKEINGNPNYNMTLRYAFYSDYVKAVHDLDLEWKVYEGDFFPFFEGSYTSWTGFYTSRPWFKLYLRQCDNLLAAAETVLALSEYQQSPLSFEKADAGVAELREATAVATHHDAITGTETAETQDDYIYHLDQASNITVSTLSSILSSQFNHNASASVTRYAAVNSLGWPRKEFVSMEISSKDAVVTDPSGHRVPSQVNPAPSWSQTGKSRLYFWVDLAPLSTAVYTIRFLETAPTNVKRHGHVDHISNGLSTLHFDQNNRLRSITDRKTGGSVGVTLEYAQYFSNDWSPQSDGAYIFRPERLEERNSVPLNPAPLVHETEFCELGQPVSYGYEGVKVWQSLFSGSFPDLHVQVGELSTLPSGDGNATETTVTFETTFDAAPIVVASATSSFQNVPVTIVKVDTRSFTVRVDKPASQWSGDSTVRVGWVAAPKGYHQSATGFRNVFTTGSSTSGEWVSHPRTSINSVLVVTPVLETTGVLVEAGLEASSRNTTHFKALLRSKTPGQAVKAAYNYMTIPVAPPKIEVLSKKVDTVVIDGPFVREIQQRHTPYIGHTFLEYKFGNTSSHYTTMVSEVGPLPDPGVDVIMRIKTALATEGSFYTDDNGLEIMKRTFSPGHVEPEGANYYPIVQRTFLRDEKKGIQLNVLSDSTHGGASLQDGQLEIMVHRRCNQDDGKGVNEVLNDQTTARATFRLSLGNFDDSTAVQRTEAIYQQHPPVLVPVAGEGAYDPHVPPLPPNVHLLTLRRFDNARGERLLVRLQHLFAAEEHSKLSRVEEVDLAQLLGRRFKWNKIEETTLTGMKTLESVDKLQWKTAKDSPGVDFRSKPLNGTVVPISPMEIRTFLIQLS